MSPVSRTSRLLVSTRVARSAGLLACAALAARVTGCEAYNRALYGVYTQVGPDATDAADATMALDVAPDATDVSDAGTDAGPLDAFDAANDIGAGDVIGMGGDSPGLVDVTDVTDVTETATIGVDATDVTDATDAITAPDASIACDAGFGANLVTNPGFEAGLLPWVYYVQTTAMATVAVTNSSPHSGMNCIEANVTNPGPAEFDVQIVYHGVPVTAGRRFHAEAWIRAATSRLVSFSVEQAAPPYATYCYRSAMIGPGWNLLAGDCTPTLSDPSALLSISLAQTAGVVAVDDVVFETLQTCP